MNAVSAGLSPSEQSFFINAADSKELENVRRVELIIATTTRARAHKANFGHRWMIAISAY